MYIEPTIGSAVDRTLSTLTLGLVQHEIRVVEGAAAIQERPLHPEGFHIDLKFIKVPDQARFNNLNLLRVSDMQIITLGVLNVIVETLLLFVSVIDYKQHPANSSLTYDWVGGVCYSGEARPQSMLLPRSFLIKSRVPKPTATLSKSV